MKRVKVVVNYSLRKQGQQYHKVTIILLAQMEPSTDQDFTDHRTGGQQTTEQFKQKSASIRTKGKRETIPIQKQRKKFQMMES